MARIRDASTRDDEVFVVGAPTGATVDMPRPAWVLLAILSAVAVAVVIFRFEPVLPGGQVATPAPAIRNAAGGLWEPLENVAGGGRPGFPEPMVRRGPELCVGFGRVDFPPSERRPTLARCIDTSDTPVGRDVLMVLDSITSGLDTWHILEVNGTVGSVTVEQAGAGHLEADRVYVGGSTIALRLNNGIELDSIDWTTEFGRFRCTPELGAWASGKFCTPDL